MLHIPVLIAAAESAKPSGLGVLGIKPSALILQLLTFLLLFFIVKKFALQKIIDLLEARRKAIDDGIRLGRKMEAEKAKFDSQIAELLQASRQDADRIIDEAHKEAGEIISRAEQTAQQKIDVMFEDARGKIERDTAAAHLQLKNEVLGLVAAATEAVLQEKVDTPADEKIIARALESVSR